MIDVPPRPPLVARATRRLSRPSWVKARYLAIPILESFGLARWFRVIVGPANEALYEPKTQTLARAVVLAKAGTIA